MRTVLLFLGSGSFFALLLAGASNICPSVLDDLGLNPSDLPTLLEALQQHQEKSDLLDARCKEIATLTATKDQIARELMAGRWTLLEAAAQFRELPGVDKSTWELALRHEQGKTEEERFCRYTIDWVRFVLEKEAAPSGASADPVASLKSELQQRLAQGPLKLP